MAVISGKPKKTLQLWIDACLNDGIGLEEWEKRLLHDARGQLAATGTLSGKVQAILKTLYETKTP